MQSTIFDRFKCVVAQSGVPCRRRRRDVHRPALDVDVDTVEPLQLARVGHKKAKYVFGIRKQRLASIWRVDLIKHSPS